MLQLDTLIHRKIVLATALVKRNQDMRAVVSPSRGNTSILQFLLSRQVIGYMMSLSLCKQSTLFHYINSIRSKRILKVEMNWVGIGVNRASIFK